MSEDQAAAVAEFSLDTALATIRDFATANGLSGEQLLHVMVGARFTAEAFGVTLAKPVMMMRHVLPATVDSTEARDAA